MSELRDAIGEAIDTATRSWDWWDGSELHNVLADAVLAVLDEHSTEEWAAIRTHANHSPHIVGVGWTTNKQTAMSDVRAWGMASGHAQGDGFSIRLASRRVSAWEPVEGDRP